MLPKKSRLSRIQFLKTKEQGFVNSSPLFTIIAHKTSGLPRFSVVVSTKVHKSAVRRNKVRRSIYQFLYTRKPSHFDLIIYPKKSVLSSDDENIFSQIDSFLSKISLS
jgi:ribonuclease P protein component